MKSDAPPLEFREACQASAGWSMNTEVKALIIGVVFTVVMFALVIFFS